VHLFCELPYISRGLRYEKPECMLAKHRKKQRRYSISYGEQVFSGIPNNGVQYGFVIDDPCGFKELH